MYRNGYFGDYGVLQWAGFSEGKLLRISFYASILACLNPVFALFIPVFALFNPVLNFHNPDPNVGILLSLCQCESSVLSKNVANKKI